MENQLNLKDYAQVQFMAAIISNADTMREITKTWTSAPKNDRIEFEELVAKIAKGYVDGMIKATEIK